MLRNFREKLKGHPIWCDTKRQIWGELLFHSLQTLPGHFPGEISHARQEHTMNVRQRKTGMKERNSEAGWERNREGGVYWTFMDCMCVRGGNLPLLLPPTTPIDSSLSVKRSSMFPVLRKKKKQQKTLVSSLPPLCLSLLAANPASCTFKIDQNRTPFHYSHTQQAGPRYLHVWYGLCTLTVLLASALLS